MKKCIVLGSLCLIFLRLAAQQVSSPQSYLGYELGTHFTPHYKIVGYFKTLASEVPDRVHLEQYGETYEGRPLLVAFITSPENMDRLESIRKNNLRLAGILRDNAPGDAQAPAIVWLSYNVHGNEPSSSEAAMKTIYELLNPSNKETKEWLKNTVVIIDPCINPDGRDRYVNWYNDATGKTPNPDPMAYEHREHWPSGRTNHYLFDLNRDWAWQTQMETRERLKIYNEWLPQVHVDFHEQGYNSPYYFAPAAEPYHEVITPWQRKFQEMVGKNNARYFDRNGWLFFTKERFDLFYPSYGDTYPMYNGAIGMTFEQGGIGAGLAVRNEDGDTLRLSDRIMHHFTTGMSTIEVSSMHAGELVKEFQKYFSEERTGSAGDFRSYIIQADSQGERIEKIKALLDRNLIVWIPLPQGTYTGVDAETGKSTQLNARPGDIAVNTGQPKASLVKVLFDRNARISDSATYDITAWSLPMVYDLKVLGLSHSVKEVDPPAARDTAASSLPASYAYAVRWKGVNSARLLASLLKSGIRVRFSEQPFSSGTENFDMGTLLITRAGNQRADLPSVLLSISKNAKVPCVPIASGLVDKGYDLGSSRVHLVQPPKIAVLAGEGVSSTAMGEIWYFFEQELEYPVSLINTSSIDQINWQNYDVVILPDGNFRFLNDKNAADALKNWVNQGGRLIAIEDAASQLARNGWGLKIKEDSDNRKDTSKETKTDYSVLHQYENREREELAKSTPGSIYRVDLDPSHPLAFGYSSHYYSLRQSETVYQFLGDRGWNVGVIKKDNYTSGFTGSKAKEKLKDGLVFGVQQMGRGEIIYLGDDPLFRNFWENGKLLFANAVFLVGQ